MYHRGNDRGRHANIIGSLKPAADDRRSTSDLWPISYNIGIADKQKSLCDVCNIQYRVKDDFVHRSTDIFYKLCPVILYGLESCPLTKSD